MFGHSDILMRLSWDPRGSIQVLSVHSFAINCQLLFFNQRKRKNGCRYIFTTKFSQKNLPDVEVNLGSACFQSSLGTDRTIASSEYNC